jgi:putative ABC transport system permease protein
MPKNIVATAFIKDLLRMWAHNWRRFMAITVITALGVAVLTGIYAGCRDMFEGTNAFYSMQRLYDIQVASTLGLTDTDVSALAKVGGVETVQPERSGAAQTQIGSTDRAVTINEIGSSGLNQPYLQQGRLPRASGEVAVTEKFMIDSHHAIGDTLSVTPKPGDSPSSLSAVATTIFPTKLTITGVVLDPGHLENPKGFQSGPFRRTATVDYAFYAPSPGIDTNVYSAISLRIVGSGSLDSFSSSYDAAVQSVMNRIKSTVQTRREQARTEQLQQAQQQAASPAESGQTQAGMTAASVPRAQWYVTARSSSGSFSNLKSDISSIELIGRAFPVVFLSVAVLMSLTAMTRMVEEDRGLIGTYIGLGYSPVLIAMRYMLFALLACLLGGALGDALGFLAIPSFLLVIMQGLYIVPGTTLLFDWTYGLAGVALFVVGVGVATAIACKGEMRQTPAALMRPKAPRAGARVLLERIRPLWRHMPFLNKVTVRNLVRFKGRLLMTVGGVAGCTALIVCGLAINDTVSSLGPRQYQQIYQYDLLAVSAGNSVSALRSRLLSDGRTTAMTTARVENGEMTNADGQSENVQLVIVHNANQFATMVTLQSADGRQPLKLSDAGIIAEQSAANALGVHAGGTVRLTTSQARQEKAVVSAVNRNLIGTSIYMTATYYERLFGESDGTDTASTPMNAVFAKLRGSADAQVSYADRLAKDASVLSATSTVALQRSFKFDLMSAVVALIVVLAGSLALTVLFTLANTNVSERIREMATLKVLGFYDREVHRYINREMLVLTLLGIVVGLPLGRYIGGLLTSALAMPALYFEVAVKPVSYLVAAGATLAFSLLVQLATNPVLDGIDPARSLKSVE